MRRPALPNYQQYIPQNRGGSFRILKYVIIAAILGSLLRLVPAINIFAAADNVGVFSEGGGGLMDESPIGGIGSPNEESKVSILPSVGGSNLIGGFFSGSNTDSTPLIQAATRGDIKEVDMLLASDMPVNGRDGDNRTALIGAAYQGQNEICLRLIDAGANIYIKDKDGFSALDFASSRGLVDTVKLLLEKGNRSDKKHSLEYAKIMQAVFAAKNDLLPKGKGFLNSVNHISPEGKSPLHVAASIGSVDMVNELLSRGADANLAAPTGQTPLHWAAWNNRTFVIPQLLKKSAKIDAKDREGNTPLILAAHKNHKEAVKLLLEKGANKNIRNKNGENAINIANDEGHAEIVAILQSKK